MSAKEAVLLQNVLGERAAEPDPIQGLAREFLTEAKPVIETAWTMSAIPDFAYPDYAGRSPSRWPTNPLCASLAFFCEKAVQAWT